MASLLVWSATAAYAATLATVSLHRLERLGGGFDLAIFTQYTWLLGHGLDPFNTINGKPLLGDHVEPGLALFAPLGALGLVPDGLLVAQAIALALVAPVLFAIARATARTNSHVRFVTSPSAARERKRGATASGWNS